VELADIEVLRDKDTTIFRDKQEYDRKKNLSFAEEGGREGE
jgi:hypothetical protein